MKSINTLFDEPSQKMNQAGNAAAMRVMEQFEATYPLFISYFRYLREIKGVHNKIDEMNKSAQILQEFNFLCKHTENSPKTNLRPILLLQQAF